MKQTAMQTYEYTELIDGVILRTGSYDFISALKQDKDSVVLIFVAATKVTAQTHLFKLITVGNPMPDRCEPLGAFEFRGGFFILTKAEI